MSSSDDDFKTKVVSKGRSKRPRTSSFQNMKVGSGFPSPPPTTSSTKKITTAKTCNLCRRSAIPGLDRAHATLLEYDSIRSHYFCLLFSSGLGQSGQEEEGLQGFMPSDVRRELKRGARLKCVYCKAKGATVGCAKQQCKKSYHLPCGVENGSLQQFFDQFKSFCSTHRPGQKVAKTNGNLNSNNVVTCSICQEPVKAESHPKSLYAPCCSSWFHRDCIQSMALNAGGHHFRCPLCNDVKRFGKEMLNFGVYLPQQDAAWETAEGGNYFDNGERKFECGGKLCFCDKVGGREYNKADGLWELLPCYTCGSRAIHAKCGGLDKFIDPEWYCYTCRRVVRDEDDEELKRRRSRPINETWGTASGKKEERTILKTPEVLPKQQQQPFDLIQPAPAAASNNSKSIDFSNTVTITPIPKNHARIVPKPPTAASAIVNERPAPTVLAPTSNSVEIRMIVPINNSTNSKPPPLVNNVKPQQQQPRLSFESIIEASLEKEDFFSHPPLMTSTQKSSCVKIHPNAGDKRHNSVDTEQGSPGDSDYESAQEAAAGLPFKIRKKANNMVTKPPPIKLPSKESLPPTTLIDLKIQKTIKDFFNAEEATK